MNIPNIPWLDGLKAAAPLVVPALTGKLSCAVLGAAVWHLAGPWVGPKVTALINAGPAWLAARAHNAFNEAVASGKIPAPVAKLIVKLKRAAFEWANEELPALAGPQKMDALVAALQTLPYIGRIAQLCPEVIRADLQAAYDATKAQVAKEAPPPVPPVVMP